jgi:hypothetical protein
MLSRKAASLSFILVVISATIGTQVPAFTAQATHYAAASAPGNTNWG